MQLQVPHASRPPKSDLQPVAKVAISAALGCSPSRGLYDLKKLHESTSDEVNLVCLEMLVVSTRREHCCRRHAHRQFVYRLADVKLIG